jgi:hypothetical protein
MFKHDFIKKCSCQTSLEEEAKVNVRKSGYLMQVDYYFFNLLITAKDLL